MEQNQLFNGAIIQLQHRKTNSYLCNSGLHLSTGSKSILLGGTSQYQLESCLFIINQPKSQEYSPIQYGDLIQLQSRSQTNLQVFLDIGNKSQVTNQKEASLNQQGSLFTILPIVENNFYSPIQQQSRVRFLDIKTHHTLHSHDFNFKQKDSENMKEITGFWEWDDNDEWIIYIHPLNFTNGIQQLQQRSQLQIHHKDKLILRNAMIGKYLTSCDKAVNKNYHQEVSLTQPAISTNLQWEIIMLKRTEKGRPSEIITHLQAKAFVAFLHVQSNLILTHIQGVKIQGELEVTCGQSELNYEEWQIIPINQQQQGLMNGRDYFYIKHVPTKSYLTSANLSSLPTKTNFRVFLALNYSPYSIWTCDETNN